MSKFHPGHRRSAKLSPGQVLEIRELYSEGATQSRLARLYGISVGQVGRIVRGEQWQGYTQIPTDQEVEDSAAAEAIDPEVITKLEEALARAGVSPEKEDGQK